MTNLYRNPHKKLLSWLKTSKRSPLMLIGARQVGKTTLLREFAKKNGKQIFEINFWKERENSPLKRVFENNRDAKKILKALEIHFDKKIDINHDILLLDEIQECPSGYECFKSFKEDLPNLKILSTGSYLQLFLENSTEVKRVPVGCVDHLYLYPLSFSEFVANVSPLVYEELDALINKKQIHLNTDQLVHEKLMGLLYEYFFTGGMPEVVSIYLDYRNEHQLERYEKTRSKQKTLINDYIVDFHKYSFATDIIRLGNAFKNIPWQLEKYQEESTSRIIIREIEKGARFSQYQSSFDYLENASLIIKVSAISKLELPLRSQELLGARNFFKAFFFDIGLLNAAIDTPPKQLLAFNLSPYKGYLAENFVAQTLRLKDNLQMYSYREGNGKNSGEIEFLFLDSSHNLLPVEVKSSNKSLKAKSLLYFIEKFKNQIKHGYKISPQATTSNQNRKIINLPIYLAEKLLHL